MQYKLIILKSIKKYKIPINQCDSIIFTFFGDFPSFMIEFYFCPLRGDFRAGWADLRTYYF